MKPLTAILSMLLASASQAGDPAPASSPVPRPASEALLSAACDTKGGLLLRAPEGPDAAPESLFGPAEPADETAGAGSDAPAEADAPADGSKAVGDKPAPKPKVLHLKARGKDPKKAKKECRDNFKEYYSRHGDVSAAVAPDVTGEMSQGDRERLLTVLTRSSPLLPLKSMSAKSITEQKTLSRRLFDGGASIDLGELPGLLSKAERALDRRAADGAELAKRTAEIHLRDQLIASERLAGKKPSPDLRGNLEYRSAARAYPPPPSTGPRTPATPERTRGLETPEFSLLDKWNPAEVPQPDPVPTSGISRGSILGDVKAALSSLGVAVLGRDRWRARYGADAPQHTPMKMTVHHSAGSPSHTDANVLGQISGWENDHIKRGFGRMGYHWVINGLGTVVEGTGTELVGSHTRANNAGNVGICLAGNFDNQEPTDKMLASLVGLMSYIGARYSMDTGSPDFVRGHEHYVRKACPGNHVMNKLGHIREKAVALVLAQKSGTPDAITVAAAVVN